MAFILQIDQSILRTKELLDRGVLSVQNLCIDVVKFDLITIVDGECLRLDAIDTVVPSPEAALPILHIFVLLVDFLKITEDQVLLFVFILSGVLLGLWGSLLIGGCSTEVYRMLLGHRALLLFLEQAHQLAVLFINLLLNVGHLLSNPCTFHLLVDAANQALTQFVLYLLGFLNCLNIVFGFGFLLVENNKVAHRCLKCSK